MSVFETFFSLLVLDLKLLHALKPKRINCTQGSALNFYFFLTSDEDVSVFDLLF